MFQKTLMGKTHLPVVKITVWQVLHVLPVVKN